MGTIWQPEQNLDHYWAKVEVTGFCWLWTGALGEAGYATSMANSKVKMVHKRSYEALVGEVPRGLQLDHLCYVRHCVNPDHLEPVTKLENVRRAHARRQGNFCLAGHEYTEENTYIRNTGKRLCRTCTLDRARSNYEKRCESEGVEPVPYREPRKVCRQGHAIEGDNLGIDSRGFRRCRICRKASQDKYDARQRNNKQLGLAA